MFKCAETFLYPAQDPPILCNSKHYFAEQPLAITVRGNLASSGHCKALAYPYLTSLGLLVSYTNLASHNAKSSLMLSLLYLSEVRTWNHHSLQHHTEGTVARDNPTSSGYLHATLGPGIIAPTNGWTRIKKCDNDKNMKLEYWSQYWHWFNLKHQNSSSIRSIKDN